jgi:PAS domain S-box-containing protein
VPTAAGLPLDARVKRMLSRVDASATAATVLFVAWLLSGVASPSRASLIDLGAFSALGLGVAALMFTAASRAAVARDRWAWRLLAASCVLRVAAGALWRWMTGAGIAVPVWSSDLSLLRCGLDLSALVLFAGARRPASDRVRHWLDVGTVIIGVGVVEWYLSPVSTLIPNASHVAATAHSPAEYAVLLSGIVGALLGALLYLRRADAGMRHAAACLTFAFGMQALADTVQWTGSVYEAGSPVTAWWWAVWLLKLVAARSALAEPAIGDPRRESPYATGLIPYAFLAATTFTLLYELRSPQRAANEWLVVATSVLVITLVVRQFVEQREHGVLARAKAEDEARFSALVRHAYDAVVLTRDDGSAAYVSPTTRGQLGDNPAFAKAWGLMEAVHPDDAPALREVLERPGDATESLACRVRQADGEWRVFALRVIDLRGDARVGAIAVHGHDITHEALLARRLHETEEVEALGVFASGLAHDLNNVLVAVSMHVELLLDEVPRASDAAQELRAMQRAVARGTRLTRALLALSRRKTQELEVVDIDEFLRASVPVGSVYEAAREPVRVRIDRAAVGHALDAVLGGVTGETADAGEWRVSVRQRLLHGRAEALSDMNTGTYAIIDCEGVLVGGEKRPVWAPQTTARADEDDAASSADEGLDVLLARAVLREMGGSLVVRADADGVRRITLYLPAGNA